MDEYDIVIVGGGEAGMIAAISAKEVDKEINILIIDREKELGGVLNSNITIGFGNEFLGRNYTAPEYSQILQEKLVNLGIEFKLNTSVIELNEKKEILAVNEIDGIFKVKAKAVILATGYSEVPRGMTNIPSSRYAGIHTLGNAKEFIHKEGFLPGKEIVIYGARDISLIFSRRLTIEGAKVKMVIDNNNYEPTSQEFLERYLNDFNIPLYLGYTIESLTGYERITGVTIGKLDENNRIINDTRTYVECDTLIISPMGRPNKDLAKMARVNIDEFTRGPQINESYGTNVEGIFACGNSIYIHDFLEDFSGEAVATGKNAVLYIRGDRFPIGDIEIQKDEGIDYVSPQYLNLDKVEQGVTLAFRVDQKYENKKFVVYFGTKKVFEKGFNSAIPGIKESIFLPKNLIDSDKHIDKIILMIE